MKTSRATALGTFLVLATWCSAARAGDDSRSARARAEALFREGKTLLKDGSTVEACAKFEASQAADPALGTLLHVALCHEQQGRVATAWREYTEAAALAARTKQGSRESVARNRASSLEPRLSRLFLSSETRGPALELYLDENRISAADAASGIPVDPGSHVLEATQEGKLPWKTKLSVPEGAKRLEVAVPALEDPKSAAAGPSVAAPPALGTPAPDTAHAPTSDAWPTIRKVGVVSIVLGTIGVGVGTVFGMQALSEARIASKECPKNACSKAGLDAVSAARSNATISTVSILGGVGLAVVGGVLVWSKGYSDYASHPKPTRNVALTPIPAGWMVGVEGTF